MRTQVHLDARDITYCVVTYPLFRSDPFAVQDQAQEKQGRHLQRVLVDLYVKTKKRGRRCAMERVMRISIKHYLQILWKDLCILYVGCNMISCLCRSRFQFETPERHAHSRKAKSPIAPTSCLRFNEICKDKIAVRRHYGNAVDLYLYIMNCCDIVSCLCQ